MMDIKRFIGFTLTAFFIVSAVAVRAPLAAQDADGGASGGGDHWKTRLNVIKDTSGPTGIEMREKLLEDIRKAIANGDTNDDIYTALDYISKEGLANNTNRQGVVLNNLYSLRQEAVKVLGTMGTERAADILIHLCGNEKIFDVQQELIIALGNIGINKNGLTVDAIFRIPLLQRYRARDTTDIDFARLVSSAIDAFDKINKKNNGIGSKSNNVQEFLDYISRKQFPRRGAPVSIQDRAKQVLGDVLRTESQRNQGG